MKKNLIVYATQYGCTEEVAHEIASQLDGDTVIINVKKDQIPDLKPFDRIIIGGSVYAGNIQKEIKNFTKTNKKILLQKPLGIFLCGIGLTDSGIANSFEFSFEQDIREHAKIMDMVGGKLNYDKMRYIDKYIIGIVVKRMKKYGKDDKLINGELPKDTLDHKKIADIARIMNKY